ncbi:MAG: hypothetical protein ACLU6Z_08790 [Odoribacter splanchnicus]
MEVLAGGMPVRCDVFDFLPGFCDMNLKKSTVPVCQLFGLLEVAWEQVYGACTQTEG